MSPFPNELLKIARDIHTQALEKKIKITTAESCTSGLIAALLTEMAGTSNTFDRGFCTYSNEAKMDLLKVSPQTLDRFGAVSAETAKEMAEGALNNSLAHIAVSVTGIAGPSGGSDEKPVGLVYIGIALKGHKTSTFKNNFEGDRSEVRLQTVEKSLILLREYIQKI